MSEEFRYGLWAYVRAEAKDEAKRLLCESFPDLGRLYHVIEVNRALRELVPLCLLQNVPYLQLLGRHEEFVGGFEFFHTLPADSDVHELGSLTYCEEHDVHDFRGCKVCSGLFFIG